MLALVSVRVTERPPVSERAFNSVFFVRVLRELFVCASFPLSFDGRMWDLIV